MFNGIFSPAGKLKKFLRSLRRDRWFLFPQQGKDTICQCLFVYNYALVQKFKANKEQLSWKDNQHWLGVTFPGVVAWQQAMVRLSDPTITENKAFYDYQQYMLANGIHLDKIYTKSGRKYYKSDLNPLKNLQKGWLSPYHFVSAAKHPQVLEKILPIYSDGEQDFIFDLEQNCYTKLDALTGLDFNNASHNNNIVYLGGSNKIFKLTEHQSNYLQLPNYACLTKINLSKHKNYKINKKFKYGYKYQYLPEEAKKNIYFHVGLFQLINLAMGIDNNNTIIGGQHELYPVYSNLRAEMTKNPTNPWSFPEFTAENNLEYQLAKIFKSNKKLMEDTLQVINNYPFNTFEHYEHLDNLYDSKNKRKRKTLAAQKKLLPCKEQMLAYSFAQSLLAIWSAAVSEKSLYAALELPKFLRSILYFSNRKYRKNIFKDIYGGAIKASNKEIPAEKIVQNNNANINNHITQETTFIQIWHRIKAILHSQGIEELFSFDGHGVVISFSDQLVAAQNQLMQIDRQDIMADLGFTVIDSLYSDSVRPWYGSPYKFDLTKLLPNIKQAMVHSLRKVPFLAVHKR
jgi:hypothetical protein